MRCENALLLKASIKRLVEVRYSTALGLLVFCGYLPFVFNVSGIGAMLLPLGDGWVGIKERGSIYEVSHFSPQKLKYRLRVASSSESFILCQFFQILTLMFY